jgi:uncharacterized protein (DUF697 family)
MSMMYDNAGEWTSAQAQAVFDKAVAWGGKDLASQFANGYKTVDEAVDSLSMGANGLSGFVTGFGGFALLPVTVPASVASSLMIRVSMTAAIASLYGYDTDDLRVKVAIFGNVLGNKLVDACRSFGVQLTNTLTMNMISRIPGRIIYQINKQIGFRVLTKMGTKGMINIVKVVPVAGGVVGGSIDATACYGVGKAAKILFRPTE